jgi:integrase
MSQTAGNRSKPRSKREGTERTSLVTRLTMRAIEAAKPLEIDGKVRQRIFWDETQPGFGVVVGKGAKSFVASGRVHGRSVRIVVGHWPMAIDKARKMALAKLVDMHAGTDPVAKRAATRGGITLAQAWAMTKEALEVKRRSVVTIQGYERFLGYLKSWNNRLLTSITPTELRVRHAAIARDCAAGRYAKGRERTPESGRYVANRVLQAYKIIYNMAAREHDLPARPWRSVNWFPEERRQTRIPPEQLAGWHAKVQKISNPVVRDYLLFALHTGLRRRSASSLTWSDVDFDKRVLAIRVAKGGKPFTLPMSSFVIELLERRRRDGDALESPYVFPAGWGDGPLADPKAHQRLGHSMHDLRRVWISEAVAAGVHPYLLKLLANHAAPRADVTMAYVVASDEELRAAMEKISARLGALCEPPPPNVVPIDRAVA